MPVGDIMYCAPHLEYVSNELGLNFQNTPDSKGVWIIPNDVNIISLMFVDGVDLPAD